MKKENSIRIIYAVGVLILVLLISTAFLENIRDHESINASKVVELKSAIASSDTQLTNIIEIATTSKYISVFFLVIICIVFSRKAKKSIKKQKSLTEKVEEANVLLEVRLEECASERLKLVEQVEQCKENKSDNIEVTETLVTPVTLDYDALRPLLENLKKHLIDNDKQALELYKKVVKKVKGTEIEWKFTRMESYIMVYDFNSALDLFKEATRFNK